MSKCACVYVDLDYSPPSFHNAKLQKARKIHVCGECRRKIQPFEEYEYVAGMWDNYFETYKTCADCLSIRREFFCDSYLYEFIKESLWEHIQDLGGNVSEDCIGVLSHLTPKAREMVCGMIEEVWDDYND